MRGIIDVALSRAGGLDHREWDRSRLIDVKKGK